MVAGIWAYGIVDQLVALTSFIMKVTSYTEICRCDTADSRVIHTHYDHLSLGDRLLAENKTCSDLFGFMMSLDSSLTLC